MKQQQAQERLDELAMRQVAAYLAQYLDEGRNLPPDVAVRDLIRLLRPTVEAS